MSGEGRRDKEEERSIFFGKRRRRRRRKKYKLTSFKRPFLIYIWNNILKCSLVFGNKPKQKDEITFSVPWLCVARRNLTHLLSWIGRLIFGEEKSNNTEKSGYFIIMHEMRDLSGAAQRKVEVTYGHSVAAGIGQTVLTAKKWPKSINTNASVEGRACNVKKKRV